MKRVKGMILLMLLTMVFSGCQKDNKVENNIENLVLELTQVPEKADTKLLEAVSYFNAQAEIDQALMKEVEKGYQFDDPLVIVNPYKNSPLTAVVIFHTEKETGGTVTVKGRSEQDDITGSFSLAYDHVVPIYGLYAGDTTEVVLTLEDGTASTVEIKTDKIDFNTDGFEVNMTASSAYDYSKLTFVCDFDANITALDSKGDLRWYFNNGGFLGVKALANGHLAVPSGYTLKTPYYKSGILEMDLLGKVYREYSIPGGMHHDIYELSNGNLLVASDHPDFSTVEDYIVELDRNTGEIVWELDLAELIDSSEGGSINRSDEDWFHNNGVWYDEASDTILLSGRHVDAIVAVDKSGKKLKWILGDPEGWSSEYQKYFFTPVGDNFEWQYAQHQVSMLSNGNIMCFDNGAGRTKITRQDQKVTGNSVYSRAVIYQLDDKNMTIKQVWEYGKELGGKFNSEWVSGAISLKDDPNNIWITSGSNLYNKEENNYDYGPSDMFLPDLIKATQIVQVKNNIPVYTMKLDFLTYRTLRLSPYSEVGAYDLKASGQYLGSFGVTSPADVTIDVVNAVPAENCTLSLDPVKLTLSADYTIPTEEELQDSYLVLQKPDAATLAYQMQQTTTVQEKNTNVDVSGYLSPVGLEGGTYHVFVVLGGVTYDTGYRVEF